MQTPQHPKQNPKHSLWKSSGDAWPFVLIAILCVLCAFFLTTAGSAYEKPNSFTNSASAMMLVAGASAIACTFGIIHMGFAVSAKVIWVSCTVLALALGVATFFGSGSKLFTPSMFLPLSLLVFSALGYWLGLRTDRYRAQFPHHPRFLHDWESD